MIRGKDSLTTPLPYGEANTPTGPLPLSLDLRFRNGNRHAFSYAFLFDVDYDASGAILLTFGESCVEIRGRHLAELYEDFLRHGVGYVQESPNGTPTIHSAPFIGSIEIRVTS
jgi:hypothetical protein